MRDIIPNLLFKVLIDVSYINRQKMDICQNRNHDMTVLNFLIYTFIYIPIIKTMNTHLYL